MAAAIALERFLITFVLQVPLHGQEPLRCSKAAVSFSPAPAATANAELDAAPKSAVAADFGLNDYVIFGRMQNNSASNPIQAGARRLTGRRKATTLTDCTEENCPSYIV